MLRGKGRLRPRGRVQDSRRNRVAVRTQRRESRERTGRRRQEGDSESQFERHMHDDKEKRRQKKLERLSQEADVNIYRQSLLMGVGRHPDDVSDHEDDAHQGVAAADGCIIAVAEEEPSRKRRRNQVDYKQLYEQMKKEGQEGI